MLSVDLHAYQEDAVTRAVERGSLLIAYEMGLGKTVIALAAIEELLGLGEVETAVIVVPASLKYQWAKQIAKLTDVPTRVIKVREDGQTQEITVPTEEYCILIDGDTKKRAGQYVKVKTYRPDYVIMGYENVVNDWNYVRRIKPECIVLDECTAIKTFKAQRTRKIKRLTAPYRYGMTGTPVENGKPEELFSIMQWVDDEVLGRFDLYDKTYIVRNKFGGVQHYKNLPVLHAKLADAMVRKTRLDEDVKPYLPEVQESTIPVTLDPKTKKAYKRISSDLLAELHALGPNTSDFDLFAHYHGGDTPNENSQQGKIMSRMQALDMLLNHPDLIVMSGQRYEESEQARQDGVQKKTWPGSKYAYEVWQDGVLDDVTTTPKLDAVTESIQDILATPKNKVIVFSVNPDMLDLIADRLPEGVAVTYTGRMSAGAKAYAANRFEAEEGCRVFLSSHAGAFGTDLWMANYLINYDLAWSSGKQDQINKRHDRASSLFKNIYVLNAITQGTTEPRKYSMLAHKRRVGSAITDGRGADDKGRIENDLVTLTQCLEAA
ncbi:DEAD/DEAH box helicase [Streptomyces sp. NPDC002088]|uniref:DEAD/DEAH box helicase n=1 Tax=Streptomyces sp. NPDC002088 TaxID=3154665 RepID=UPI0033219805